MLLDIPDISLHYISHIFHFYSVGSGYLLTTQLAVAADPVVFAKYLVVVLRVSGGLAEYLLECVKEMLFIVYKLEDIAAIVFIAANIIKENPIVFAGIMVQADELVLVAFELLAADRHSNVGGRVPDVVLAATAHPVVGVRVERGAAWVIVVVLFDRSQQPHVRLLNEIIECEPVRKELAIVKAIYHLKIIVRHLHHGALLVPYDLFLVGFGHCCVRALNSEIVILFVDLLDFLALFFELFLVYEVQLGFRHF